MGTLIGSKGIRIREGPKDRKSGMLIFRGRKPTERYAKSGGRKESLQDGYLKPTKKTNKSQKTTETCQGGKK